MSAVVQTLKDARDFLGRDGVWAQGKQACDWQRSCVVLALKRSTRTPEVFIRALAAVRAVVGRNVVDWNDTPGRTVLEVQAVLDKAIHQEQLHERP